MKKKLIFKIRGVEVDSIDIVERELSTISTISPEGLRVNLILVFGVAPSPDIKTEVGFQRFLDLVFKKDYDAAVHFE